MAEAVNKFDGIRESSFSTNEIINEYKDVTTYDYYELPTDKDGPAAVLAKPRRRQNSCRVMPTVSTAASAPIWRHESTKRNWRSAHSTTIKKHEEVC